MTKIKKTALSLLCLALFSFYIIGCKGVAGPTGPQGIQGNQGNANVHSKTYTVTSWDGVGTSFAFKDIANSDITQEIIDNGAILVYEGNTGLWNAMPYANQNDEWRFLIGLNNFRVILLHANGTTVSNPGTRNFKVVIISGDALISNPNINWKDYEEVKAKLNLQE